MFPILAIRGSIGTGKSTLLEFLEQIAFDTAMLEGPDTTFASLRDKMSEFATLLIDEDASIHEGLILSRYLKSGASIERKAPLGSRDCDTLAVNVYGATGVHQRRPFQDPAAENRAIVLKTVPKSSVSPMTTSELDEMRVLVRSVAERVEWSDAELGRSRLLDTWRPLLLVAQSIGDEQWVAYAPKCILEATDPLLSGRDYEPQQLVYLALLRLAIGEDGSVCWRVKLADVRQALVDDGGEFNSWQISQRLQDAKLEVT